MKKLLAITLTGLSALTAAAEAPLWLRDVKISPDGNTIAFTYKGDIYTVPAAGGDATRLTTAQSYESEPVWSPDGKLIAFASDRHGSQDVFVMPATGGPLTRLTSFSGGEIPEAFSADGKQVYFSAAIQDPAESAAYPSGRLTELYQVPATGGAVTRVLATPAQMLSVSRDGKFFLYQDQKGLENEWRKHHTSSVTRGLWRYDFATGKHTPLIDHAGEDRNPVIAADGKNMLFLSERNGGSMNVYTAPLDNPEAITPVTSFKEHPVRFLSQGANGVTAMAYDGEIYTLAPGAKSPKKVTVNIVADDYDAPAITSFSSGASEAVPSPDGKMIAFVRRGDVFVTSVEYNTTKQVSATPQAESSPTWADNRTLYYVSDRDGNTAIYKAAMAREEDADFPNATTVTEECVYSKPGVHIGGTAMSPDGKKLAFIQDRSRIMVMDTDSKKVTQITDGSQNRERSGIDFDWSPDSRWIAFTQVAHGHAPYSDIAIVNVDGEKPVITALTETGYFDMSPRWSPDGSAVLFASDRYGMRNHASWGSLNDVMAVFVNQEAMDRFRLSAEDLEIYKEAAKKAKKKEADEKKDDKKVEDSAIKVEREGIQDRLVRLTPYSSDLADAVVTKEGDTLYYLSKVEGGYDLWKLDLRKGDASIANKLNAGGGVHMALNPDATALYLLSGSMMKKMALPGGKITNISYSGRQHLDRAAERDYMLEFVRRMEAEKFYVKDMHGVKWNPLVDHYRRFLPHIANNYDYAEMLSELLGELNVSHTGSGYRAGGADEATADLGLIYDFTFAGPGLKVAEVVQGGPLDRTFYSIKPGDVITAVNGTKLTHSTDFSSLFNGLAGRKTLLTVRPAAGGDEFEQVVKPVSRGAMADLLYKRWVRRRAAEVDSLSGGRLGYVHIESMNDDSFRPVYADVLGKYNDREGIVIDTRWNGGGRMHEDIEVLFSGHKYLTQEVRGEQTCDMPSRRWNKPSIMLICEANYSNAHGTPWVYSNRGLGSLVGMPVPGTMTSVNWVTLQDPSLYFGIPVIGYRTAEGNFLENSQLEPDVKVANAPERLASGHDDQLRAAVETLLKQIDRK